MKAHLILKSWRMAAIAAAILALGASANARPQAATKPQQSDPTVEAARKARDQKKAAGKQGRVWDNDNIALPMSDVEVIGPNANAPATDANGGASSDQTANAAEQSVAATALQQLSPEELAQVQQSIKELQEKVADLKQDVDLAQRKYTLDAAMFYGKPDFVEDKDGQKAINQEKSGVDDKKQQLQAAEQALAKLQGTLAAAPQAKATETKPPEPSAPNPQTQSTSAPANAPGSPASPAPNPPATNAPATNAPDNKPPDTQTPQANPQQQQQPPAKPPIHES
jgi:hypothetical protein